MEDYTSNSHKSKEIMPKPTEDIHEKKRESVVSGEVKTTKKSGLHKLKDVIVAEDASNVKSYIFMDVLVPAIKKALHDTVTGAADMFFGMSDSSRRTTASKISYRSYYDDKNDRNLSSTARTAFDYDNIVFSSRGDAEAVLSAMEDILSQFGVVSVGDLYDLADISTSNYTINKYGWTNIRSAQVVRGRDGYLLKLPRALPIN